MTALEIMQILQIRIRRIFAVVVVVDSVGNATLPRNTVCCICIDIQYLLLSLCEFRPSSKLYICLQKLNI